jgi:hypothetical protein
MQSVQYRRAHLLAAAVSAAVVVAGCSQLTEAEVTLFGSATHDLPALVTSLLDRAEFDTVPSTPPFRMRCARVEESAKLKVYCVSYPERAEAGQPFKLTYGCPGTEFGPVGITRYRTLVADLERELGRANVSPAGTTSRGQVILLPRAAAATKTRAGAHEA